MKQAFVNLPCNSLDACFEDLYRIYIYCIYGVYAVKIRWLALGCLFFLWFCFGTCRRLGFPRRNTMMHWHSLVLWVADSFAVRLQNSTLETVWGEDGTIVLNQLLPRFCTGVCVPVPFSLSFSGLDDRAAFLRWLKYWKRGALQHKEHITSFWHHSETIRGEDGTMLMSSV